MVAAGLLQSHLQVAAAGFRLNPNPNTALKPNMTLNPNTGRWGEVVAGGLLQSHLQGSAVAGVGAGEGGGVMGR